MQNKLLITFTLVILGILAYTAPLSTHASQINDNDNLEPPSSRVASYDISQWQGPINNDQASGLKNEVHFMILKAENGSLYKDPQFGNTSRELAKNHIPYGAYDYSIYNGPDQAMEEASALYRRAPKANFYVNDCEENNAGDELDTATQTWADEMHQLTRKPVILYSDLSFMNNLLQSTRNVYNALWVADYGNEPDPAWHYDLWQYTDKHYSPALGQYVDASIVPYGGRSITFWTNRHSINTPKIHKATRSRYRSRVSHRDTEAVHQRPQHLKRIRRHVSFSYYHSPHVRHLIVTHRSGINLYALNGRYLRHVKRFTILHVRYFRRYPYTRSTYMTRAVDYLHHRWVMYTARKSKLIPYYFE